MPASLLQRYLPRYFKVPASNSLEAQLFIKHFVLCPKLGFQFGACPESAIITALGIVFGTWPWWASPILHVSVRHNMGHRWHQHVCIGTTCEFLACVHVTSPLPLDLYAPSLHSIPR